MTTSRWIVHRVDAVDIDYSNILRRSSQDFGAIQAEIYAETITLAIEALAVDGTAAIGAKERKEIGVGIFTLHVARLGRKGSHFLVFRLIDGNEVEILRILHERMDLERHISLESQQH